MPVTVTGTGIRYSNIAYNPYGTESNPAQTRCSPVVKIRSTSASTINQTTGGAGHTFVNGTEIDMGVPTKSSNWYRCMYQTIVDDWDGNYGGIGFSIWRWTPSTGWNRSLDMGRHASYDNNMGDWYRNPMIFGYVPALNGSEQHVFRIYVTNYYGTSNVRINCGIGNDLLRNGWINNIFEVWEIDGQGVHTTGTMSRY
jgi:hypothetical protein